MKSSNRGNFGIPLAIGGAIAVTNVFQDNYGGAVLAGVLGVIVAVVVYVKVDRKR